MAAGLDLSFVACRLTLRALEPIQFPDPAANRFRGALGMILPKEVFRPSAATGPSGFRDRPRPFVLRTTHLDNRGFEPGQLFEAGFNSFIHPAQIVDAFARVGWAELAGSNLEGKVLDLSPRTESVERVRVQFLTPTEIKPWVAAPGALPPFEILATRLRDRLSSLRLFYGSGPLAIDFREAAEAASRIVAVDGSMKHHTAARLSGRTGQTHPLGGFVGHVDYTGDLTRFLSWLEAGYWTGVGRQTVWGHGIIRVESQQDH